MPSSLSLRGETQRPFSETGLAVDEYGPWLPTTMGPIIRKVFSSTCFRSSHSPSRLSGTQPSKGRVPAAQATGKTERSTCRTNCRPRGPFGSPSGLPIEAMRVPGCVLPRRACSAARASRIRVSASPNGLSRPVVTLATWESSKASPLTRMVLAWFSAISLPAI